MLWAEKAWGTRQSLPLANALAAPPVLCLLGRDDAATEAHGGAVCDDDTIMVRWEAVSTHSGEVKGVALHGARQRSLDRFPRLERWSMRMWRSEPAEPWNVCTGWRRARDLSPALAIASLSPCSSGTFLSTSVFRHWVRRLPVTASSELAARAPEFRRARATSCRCSASFSRNRNVGLEGP